MKALLFTSKDEPLKIAEVEKPSPKQGEVLIKISYASLNHLDLWIRKEKEASRPVILGSDASGIVIETGPGANEQWMNKEVIINPGLHWGNNEHVQSPSFEILGYPRNGTFAEFIAIPEEYVCEKPEHLSFEEAAALPLAGVTATRILFTKAKINPGDKILITGIGGGVALYLLQLAAAYGCKVYVTSSDDKKIAAAIKMGAVAGFNYKDPQWADLAKGAAGGFDVIADSAGGNGFAQLVAVANPAARIAIIGRTAGNLNNVSPGLIYNKQLHIMGSLMGSASDFKQMLSLYSRYKLRPVIDKCFTLDQAAEAFEYMDGSRQFGKITLKVQP